MRVSVIQSSLEWENSDLNFKSFETKINGIAPNSDLVVLPEMFTTGFCTDQLELAETMEGQTVRTLQKWAQTYNLAITGSFIANENNKIFNRGFFVFPDGKIETADKRHLFSMGGEDQYFSAGDRKLIVNYCGFNIRLLVCYDVRFPVWARNLNNEYDLLIYVANFPKNRIKSWDILLQARAIENQAYVCGVNRVGMDGLSIDYNGHSTLLDFKATPLLSFPENETSMQTYELNPEPLLKFREKSAFWKDADKFEII